MKGKGGSSIFSEFLCRNSSKKVVSVEITISNTELEFFESDFVILSIPQHLTNLIFSVNKITDHPKKLSH